MRDTDAAPTIALLLEQRDWVERLARSLVSDENTAADLAQDTMLRALTHPPAAAHGLRGWFATILRNGARQLHRGERRRHQRERIAARGEALPATEHLAEIADLQTRVVRALLDLPEPGRRTLLHHYFEGLPLREIARREKTSVETVRSRHRRALERIREHLDQASGGRSAWAAVAAALPTASKPVGVLMTTKTVIGSAAAAAIVFTGYLGYTALQDPTPDGTATAALDAPVPPELAATTASLQDTPEARPAPSRVAVAPKPGNEPTPALELRGRLRGLQPAAPWTTALAHGKRALAVAADGTFVCKVPRGEGTVQLFADDPRYMPFRSSFEYRVGTELEVPVQPAAVILGTLLDSRDQPVPAARVSLHGMRDGRPTPQPLSQTISDDAGRLRLRVGKDGSGLLVILPPQPDDDPDAEELKEKAWLAKPGIGCLPAGVATQFQVGTETELMPIRLRKGLAVRGQVRLLAGKPLPMCPILGEVLDDGATTIFPEGADLLWWPDGTIAPKEHFAKTDSLGRYEFLGLPRKPILLQLDYFTGRVILHAADLQRRVTPPRTNFDFVLDVSTLTVRAEFQGRPVEHAHIGCSRKKLLVKGSSDRGTSRMLIQQGQTYRIVVTAKGFAPVDVEHVASGVDEERVLTLRQRPTRKVRVRLTGAAADVARFTWTPEDRDNEDALRLDADRSPKDGWFVFNDVPPGNYRLQVRRPRMPAQHFTSTLVGHERTLRVPNAVGPMDVTIPIRDGGRLQLLVTDAKDAPLGATCEIRDVAGRVLPVQFQVGDAGGYVTGQTGEILARGKNETAEALPPGQYAVKITLPAKETQTRRATIRPGELTQLRFKF